METVDKFFPGYGRYIVDPTIKCSNSCAVTHGQTRPTGGVSISFSPKRVRSQHAGKKYGSYSILHHCRKLNDGTYLSLMFNVSDDGKGHGHKFVTASRANGLMTRDINVISTSVSYLSEVANSRVGTFIDMRYVDKFLTKEEQEAVKKDIHTAWKGKYVILVYQPNYYEPMMDKIRAVGFIDRKPIYVSPLFNNLVHPAYDNYLVLHIYDYTKE